MTAISKVLTGMIEGRMVGYHLAAILAGYLLDAARFQTLYQYLARYFQTDFPASSSQVIYQSLIQANSSN